ncbi:MAG: carboxylesterase family protein [Flavitalea sp.]
MRIPAISFAMTAIACFNFISLKAQLPFEISTSAGKISGTTIHNNITIFKGIPFAAPPVGALRWKAPQPVKAWTDVRECNRFGPSPMQPSPAPFSMWSQEFLIPKEPISEDCLYLNVWTAAKSQKEKRPVLVWIYGGGFGSGGSAVPIYDGESFASKSIVFVSINYRVGIFGFLAHPELTAESSTKSSGNYGLMDQVAALKWVQQNIAAFGGDPENVTIAGQSAGSMSVNSMVASPLAKGLFIKAIPQSGANFTSAAPSLKSAEDQGLATQESLGVNSLEALRSLSAEDLLQKSKGRFWPVVDGYVLPASIAEIFAQNKENKVSLLTGWNQDEGLAGAPVSAAEFRRQAAQYGADSAAFLRYYPSGNDEQSARSQNYLSRDQIFGAQNYTWANIASAKNQKVYVYRFTRKVPATGDYIKYGAFHTGEVPYAYNNLRFVDRPWEKEDIILANQMSSYWINFIKTGDPNGAGLPKWPLYNKQSKQIIFFDKVVTAGKMKDAAGLDLLVKILSKKE